MERSCICNSMAPLKGLERKGEIIPQMNRWQAIIKLRVETKNRNNKQIYKESVRERVDSLRKSVRPTNPELNSPTVEGGDPD